MCLIVYTVFSETSVPEYMLCIKSLPNVHSILEQPGGTFWTLVECNTQRRSFPKCHSFLVFEEAEF